MGGRQLFSGVDSPSLRECGSASSGRTAAAKPPCFGCSHGELEPDAGEIRRADRLRIVRFDQDREQLDPTRSLRRALAPESDTVVFRGSPIHVAAWAKRFLFDAGPARHDRSAACRAVSRRAS